MRRRRRCATGAVGAALALVVAAWAVPAPGAAQSALERPPNLEGGWVSAPGPVHLHIVHRFDVVGDNNKLVASPTFVLAAGLPGRLLAGLGYASASNVAAKPNEFELFGRWRPVGRLSGAGGLAVQVGYNTAVSSFDGELTGGVELGRLTVFGTARGFSRPYGERSARAAVGGGLVGRLTRWVGVGGDVVTLTDRGDDERIAWSAGLLLGIPYTPHTLSLHATNVNTGTLQGGARGRQDVRYGFEFTIPFTPARFFGPPREPPPAPPTPPVATPSAGADTVHVVIDDEGFEPRRIEIGPGTTVVWTNRGDLPHTATDDDGGWGSPLLMPGEAWAHTFDSPGRFPYFCLPHPFMRGEVVVATRAQARAAEPDPIR